MFATKISIKQTDFFMQTIRAICYCIFATRNEIISNICDIVFFIHGMHDSKEDDKL